MGECSLVHMLATFRRSNTKLFIGPTYLSSTVNTQTQVEFLTHVKGLVEKMAHDLVHGKMHYDFRDLVLLVS